MRRVYAALLGVGLLALSATNALAVGCAMCKQTAEALGEEGQDALDVGILMLMGTFFLLAALVIYFIYNRAQLDKQNAQAALIAPTDLPR